MFWRQLFKSNSIEQIQFRPKQIDWITTSEDSFTCVKYALISDNYYFVVIHSKNGHDQSNNRHKTYLAL